MIVDEHGCMFQGKGIMERGGGEQALSCIMQEKLLGPPDKIEKVHIACFTGCVCLHFP